MFRFQKNYFLLTSLIFLIEILIAKFVHDHFIRPFVGDILVVILIYCFIKSFSNVSVLSAAISVLIFSYLVEILQYFDIITKLNLQHSKFARTIIGTSFDWKDILAYSAGTAIILVFENIQLRKTKQ
jgi:hypothetical protein